MKLSHSESILDREMQDCLCYFRKTVVLHLPDAKLFGGVFERTKVTLLKRIDKYSQSKKTHYAVVFRSIVYFYS